VKNNEDRVHFNGLSLLNVVVPNVCIKSKYQEKGKQGWIIRVAVDIPERSNFTTRRNYNPPGRFGDVTCGKL
jgi:hypothetical protein